MEIDAFIDALVSHALSLGVFDRVNAHEPKAPPGSGITCALWVQSIAPIPGGSSLIATSGRVLFNVRLYSNALIQPLDLIDPTMVRALDGLMTAYSADFTLDGLIRNVDLLGQYGIPLDAQAGYVEVSGQMNRVYTLEVPLVVNDLWSQSP